jgi:hypothetical protein
LRPLCHIPPLEECHAVHFRGQQQPGVHKSLSIVEAIPHITAIPCTKHWKKGQIRPMVVATLACMAQVSAVRIET